MTAALDDRKCWRPPFDSHLTTAASSWCSSARRSRPMAGDSRSGHRQAVSSSQMARFETEAMTPETNFGLGRFERPMDRPGSRPSPGMLGHAAWSRVPGARQRIPRHEPVSGPCQRSRRTSFCYQEKSSIRPTGNLVQIRERSQASRPGPSPDMQRGGADGGRPSDVGHGLRALYEGHSRPRWRANVRAIPHATCGNDDPGRWERPADKARRLLLRGSRLVPARPQGRRCPGKTCVLRDANVPITDGHSPQNSQELSHFLQSSRHRVTRSHGSDRSMIHP